MDNPTFAGEVQLMNWGESSNSGAWVKFWINSEDLEAFRHLKTRTAKIAGHRFMAVLVEIGDDEQPVGPPEQQPPSPQHSAREDKPKGGPLARLAGQWCDSEDFRAWLINSGLCPARVVKPDGTITPTIAADVVRAHCGVISRAELDNNPDAGDLFNRRIRIPYMNHKNGGQA